VLEYGFLTCFFVREEDAYPILQRLDVDYVLVLYGGVARYQSDDINKFLWPIRIAGGVFPNLVQVTGVVFWSSRIFRKM
jgi:hypothetical protein